VIALATVVLGALLFTQYAFAYKADLRGDAKAMYRLLGYTTLPWLLVTLINVVQADVLFVVINIAMTVAGLWAWAEYRVWDRAEKAAKAWVAEHQTELRDVLDSHRGGDAS